MAERLLYVDTDLFILLAAAGLLDRAARLLGFEMADVRRLDPLSHQLKRSGGLSRKYDENSRRAALEACDRVAAITERPDDDRLLDRLASIDDIDDGEALMLALAAENGASYLASGDKRAMIALVTRVEVRDVRDRVAGRIVCLEALVKLLVNADGVTPIATAFAPVCPSNRTLSIFFAAGAATTPENCLPLIESYVRDLERQLGIDFLYRTLHP
jgi:hypothetical protein